MGSIEKADSEVKIGIKIMTERNFIADIPLSVWQSINSKERIERQTIKKTILIIDGNEAARASLQETVAAEGYEVRTAATGQEGIERAREEFPDAVILEERLADTSGVAALKELNRIKPGVRVVMLTRRGTIDGAVTAIKAGASDYILKPPELSRLMLGLKEAAGQ